MAPPADAGVPPLAGRSGPLEEGPPDSAFQADGANHGRRDGGAGFQGLRWHYEALVEDVAANEGDRVPLPRYAGEESSAAAPDSVAGSASAPKDGGGGGGGGHRREERKSGVDVGKSCSKAEQERRKGIPWTEKEHRLFLLGLDKFGKGDWLGLEGSDLRASNQSNQQLRGESLFLFTSLLGSTQIKNPNLGELPAHSSTKYISDKNAPRKQEYLVCSFVGTKKCI